MKSFSFRAILQKNGWQENQSITIDENGIISNIGPSSSASKDLLLPGFKNAHSHAFQYAFAGMTESLGGNTSSDNFWSWREEMYKLALGISPEQLYTIATRLYKEMVRVGYTHVAEFHYLHHDQKGKAYSNRAEMSLQLMEAAKQAGIALTLLPIFYQKGGFGKDANIRQKRFISSDLNEYLKLVEAIQKEAKSYNDTSVGVGVHSLRAVDPREAIQTFKHFSKDVPKHIHISEQVAEVEDCKKTLGKRPVEWLLENVQLDSTFHLVHATHINEKELVGIIEADAHVVLCPSTEANLGDGIFPFRDYVAKNGQWSIGTDSHIGLSPFEELRWLEYSQRLQLLQRNPLCQKPGDESGDILFHQAMSGGEKALGLCQQNYFAIGEKFRGFVVDSSAPALCDKPLNKMISTLVFACDTSVVKEFGN